MEGSVVNNNEIRRNILKFLYDKFKDGKRFVEGYEILDFTKSDEKVIYANLHYLDDKQLINIIWRPKGYPVAKINAAGIDLLEDASEFNKAFPVSITYDSSINISDIHGNLTGIGITGDNNKISSNNKISDSFNVNNKALSELPKEYSQALSSFSDNIKREMMKLNLKDNEIKKIQESINELIEETKGIGTNESIGIIKQQDFKEKFFKVLKNVLPVLPKTAETIAAFSPLSPFSKFIGEAVERIVKNVQNEL